MIWNSRWVTTDGIIESREAFRCRQTPMRSPCGWAAAGRREIGTVVDLFHAATSVGFSVVNPRWRRAALMDTAVTSGFVVLGVTNR